MSIPIIRVDGNKAVVVIDDCALYFSYSTCVAARLGLCRIRRDRTFSRTTAKHMADMGIEHWPQASDDAFERTLREATV